MRLRVGVMLAGILLAGCTEADWSENLSRVGLYDRPAQPAAAPPGAVSPMIVPAKSTPDDQSTFCTDVARQAADTSVFDEKTRQQIYLARLAQCRSLVSDEDVSAPRKSGIL